MRFVSHQCNLGILSLAPQPSPHPTSHPGSYLFRRNLDALPQALDDELLAHAPAEDVLDVVSRGLEVAGGGVALGDEDVVLGAVLDRLVEGDGGTLHERNHG